MNRSEYSANTKLTETAVIYSAEWMKPAKQSDRFAKRNWLQKLIRWIAGF